MGWAQRSELVCWGHPAGEERGGGGTYASHQRGHQWLWLLCPRARYTPPPRSWGPAMDLDWSQKSALCLMSPSPKQTLAQPSLLCPPPLPPGWCWASRRGQPTCPTCCWEGGFSSEAAPLPCFPTYLGMRSTARSANSSPTTPPRAATLGAGSLCLSAWAASPPLRSLLRYGRPQASWGGKGSRPCPQHGGGRAGQEAQRGLGTRPHQGHLFSGLTAFHQAYLPGPSCQALSTSCYSPLSLFYL